MKRVLPLLLTLAAFRPAAAEDPVDQKFAPLLALLGHDKWEERERAQQEILALGPAAAPLVKKALESATDPEVKMRLRQIMEDLGRPRWASSLRAGIDEATKLGKPLLIVAGDGPLEKATSEAGAALRRVSLGDPGLVVELNSEFVLAWWNATPGVAAPDAPPDAARSGEGDRGPAQVLGFYFCTPRGSVRHFLPGWWRPETLRAEVARARKLLEAPDASEGLKRRSAETAALAVALDRLGAEPTPERERLAALLTAWRDGDEVVGERIETYLANRLKDWRAGGGQIR